VRRLLSHRDARLLLAGQTLSVFGDKAMLLALGIWVKTLTGSTAAAGLVFFVYAAPGLLAPIAGLLVDRVRARPLMIVTDCVAGLAVLSLVTVHGRGQVWLVYTVTLVYGCVGSVLASARSALLTRMLAAELLGHANAALQTLGEGSRLVSPLVGAGLFAAFGGGAVAAVDAATFAVSAACLAAIGLRERRPEPAEHHLRAQLVAGVRYIARSHGLRRIVTATAVALLVVGFAETIVFAVIQHGLHRRPTFLGVLEAAQGVGAITGGITAGAALRRLGDARVLGLGMLIFAAGVLAFLVPSVAVVLAGFAVVGAGIAWAIVAMGTAIQLRTPSHLQGRVYSTVETLVGTPQTFSIALGAGLVGIVDYRALVVVMSAVTAMCGAYLLSARLAPTGGGVVAGGEHPPNISGSRSR
jgi:MFS family permease